jgi:homoserine kinase
VLGLAVDLSLTIRVEETSTRGFEVIREGDMSHAPRDPRHDAILRALNAIGENFRIHLPPGLRITASTSIPAFSGLGTNSAAFAAGFGIAARYGAAMPPADELLDVLVELGGTAAHGGAALYGGLVASCAVQTARDTESHRVLRYALSDAWRVVIACPDFHLATADAMRVLPATLPHGVVRRTSGRLLGLLHALAVGDDALLGNCLVDEVHVPFRRSLVPGLSEALRKFEAEDIAGVTISGAGPALVMLTTDPQREERAAVNLEAAFREAGINVRMIRTRCCTHGALPDQSGIN